jgi:hypothetical protein
MVSSLRIYISEQARGTPVLRLLVGWADSGLDGLCIEQMTAAASNPTLLFLTGN